MQLKILSDHDVQTIDKAARKILSRIGVLVPHEQMLDMFDKAGAQTDKTSGCVKIPSELVDQCIAQAGKNFTIYGRDRQNKAQFGLGKRNYNSSAGQAHWIDGKGTRRFACLDDVHQAAKLAHVLPEINIAGAMADPHEIDIAYRCVEVAASLLKTTTKPVTFWFHDRASAKAIVELLTAVAGSREQLAHYPLTYPFLEPISPLRFDTNGIDLLFETSAVPLPVSIGPMAQTGLSAPGTLAATVAQETAEILAGICVVQLIKPQTPVCFGGICHAFDMRTTQIIFGGPEQALMAVACVQMGQLYGLPVYTNTGLTDSKAIDAQAGIETAATLLMAALAGSDIFGHLGIAGADQGASLNMLMLQHEVIEYVERIMKGMTVNNEKLALDVIEEVGHNGTFIDHMHTAMNFREELWMPKILDRSFWDDAKNTEHASLAARVAAKTDELLASYEPPALDDTLRRDMDAIVSNARTRLTK